MKRLWLCSIARLAGISRVNQVLAALLIVQAVVLAIVLWPRSTRMSTSVAGTAGELLLPGLQADQVMQVRMYPSATIGDDQQASIELLQREGKWVIPAAGDYPCKEGAVPDFLAKLVALKRDRLVTQTADSHKRLKVADQDFVRVIELRLADNTVRRLYLGTSASSTAVHIRIAEQDQVYLAPGLSTGDIGAQAASWVDTLYSSIPQDQMVSVTLQNANGRLALNKGEDGTWTLADLATGETLNQSAVTSWISRVASVRMVAPLGTEAQASYGLDSLNAVVQIEADEYIRTKGQDGATKTYTLQVGAQDEQDKTYVFKSSESPYYIRVGEYTVADWVGKKRADFLQLPPTPTPATTPTPEAGS